MRHDQYQTLPEEIELTCQYRGHREAHSSFMSSAQHARVMAAAERLAEQWLHEQVNDIFSRTFGPGVPQLHVTAAALAHPTLVRRFRCSPQATALAVSGVRGLPG